MIRTRTTNDHRDRREHRLHLADAAHGRTGRRRVAPLAGLAVTAGLLAGAGAAAADGPGSGDGENLFEGTWTFGYTEKTLTAEELGDVVEAKAEARGPDEMSLSVRCADGIDTSVRDYVAYCVAIADEGVEHPWKLTGGPADAGLVVEVENFG
ncbi:hypothetical protein [Brachybacterium fresconis]|uniref:Uncharacterized protein n=1 Tax=Brachybacterium fresconis TaxID=173363 RepID=A0ABS4YKR7_9MICO|nr:hypothetical protein [Brachybacterium fresconis]MBP2409396.1 hypothetical protein [Brachybacterium fresconis]